MVVLWYLIEGKNLLKFILIVSRTVLLSFFGSVGQMSGMAWGESATWIESHVLGLVPGGLPGTTPSHSRAFGLSPGLAPSCHLVLGFDPGSWHCPCLVLCTGIRYPMSIEIWQHGSSASAPLLSNFHTHVESHKPDDMVPWFSTLGLVHLALNSISGSRNLGSVYFGVFAKKMLQTTDGNAASKKISCPKGGQELFIPCLLAYLWPIYPLLFYFILSVFYLWFLIMCFFSSSLSLILKLY